MHTRYIVAVGALALWIAVSVPAWVSDPLTRGHLLGAANAGHLLLLGAIGFVVVGTLYHIIPFVIWVNRYSDLLGLEDVPMIDDLYDDRIAAIDGALLGERKRTDRRLEPTGRRRNAGAARRAASGHRRHGVRVQHGSRVGPSQPALDRSDRVRLVLAAPSRAREVSMRRRTDMSHRKNTGEP